MHTILIEVEIMSVFSTLFWENCQRRKVCILFVLMYLPGTELCNIDICLTWTVKTDQLILRCRVSQMRFYVKFFNQYNKEQGYCLPPIPQSECHWNYANASLVQHVKQNITILTVKGHITNHLDGPWQCTHGTNTDKASINITVLKVDSHLENIPGKEKRCVFSFIGVSTCSLMIVLTFVNLVAVTCRKSIIDKINIKYSTLEEKCPRIVCYLKKEDKKVWLKKLADFVQVVMFISIPVLIDKTTNCSTYHVELVMILYGVLCALLRCALCFARKVYKDGKLDQQQAHEGEGSSLSPTHI